MTLLYILCKVVFLILYPKISKNLYSAIKFSSPSSSVFYTGLPSILPDLTILPLNLYLQEQVRKMSLLITVYHI